MTIEEIERRREAWRRQVCDVCEHERLSHGSYVDACFVMGCECNAFVPRKGAK